MKKTISIAMLPQPTEVSCGPTCLRAIYEYYDDQVPIENILKEVAMLEQGGGTLAVILACHALRRGYRATIYTYNLQMFDPTWFKSPPLNANQLIQKLTLQAEAKHLSKYASATAAYIEFLQLGGKLLFQDLDARLIRHYLTKDIPIITGLSSTYLYQTARERIVDNSQTSDDIRGEPEGHFVVLCGYDLMSRKVWIADPYHANPYSPTLNYAIYVDRLIGAILLGIITHDANLLVIMPKKGSKHHTT
jgi:hypothetical protein